MLDRMQQWSNQKIIIFMLSLSGLMVLIGLVVNFSQTKESGNYELKVATTIFPVYDIVRNIAPEDVEVVLLLPPGVSPHTYELSPSDAAKVKNSAVLFSIDQALDGWAVDSARNLSIGEVVELSENIDLIEEDATVDPHYWLSVPNALLMSMTVSRELIKVFPDYKMEIESNYKKYLETLIALDRTMRDSFGKLDNRKIATFHESWRYFAKDYGIDIVAVYEKQVGNQLTARDLAEFLKTVSEQNVRAVFSEEQFADDQISVAAKDAGVYLSELDPIGGIEGRDSYVKLMLFNTERIVNAK